MMDDEIKCNTGGLLAQIEKDQENYEIMTDDELKAHIKNLMVQSEQQDPHIFLGYGDVVHLHETNKLKDILDSGCTICMGTKSHDFIREHYGEEIEEDGGTDSPPTKG